MSKPLSPHPDIAAFLTHLANERDVSPHTLRAYTNDLARFEHFLRIHFGVESWDWNQIDRLALRSFLGHLTREHLSRRSIART
ncbi:MAG TPA: site-specific integrase, partial [Gemmatimonadaceae bacterium]